MTIDATRWRQRISPEQAAAWRREGAWADRTVSSLAREIARTDPGRVTHVADGRRWTAGELVGQAQRLATSLAVRGFVAGDVVSFQLPNWTEAVVVDLAASMLGLVVNPIVSIYRDAEVELILDDCGAKAIFVPATFRGYDHAAMIGRIRARLPKLQLVCGVRVEGADGAHVPAGTPAALRVERTPEDGAPDESDTRLASLLPTADRFELLTDPGIAPWDGAEPDPDSLKMIMYTSGTTGRPKGVLHSHNTLARAIRMCAQFWGIRAGDAFLMASPVTHVTGYSYGIEMPFLWGTHTVFMDRWQPDEALGLIEAERVVGTVGATPFLQELLDAAERAGKRLPSLRVFACGGAAVPPELIRRAWRTLENCRAFRVYGSSEAPVITLGFVEAHEQDAAADTDGRIVDYEVRVLGDDDRPVAEGAEGEICARGPAVMLGYADPVHDAEAFDADGFFRSGDIGYVNALGAVVITGRKKDLINRGGEKVSAKEIEDILHAHPAIREAAIVSMPHARLGETVCAYAILRDGQSLTLAQIIDAVTAAGVAKQKCPERLEVVADLPRTASGKVKKDLLRVDIRERMSREKG